MMQLDPSEDDSDDSNGRESPVGESAVDAEVSINTSSVVVVFMQVIA